MADDDLLVVGADGGEAAPAGGDGAADAGASAEAGAGADGEPAADGEDGEPSDLTAAEGDPPPPAVTKFDESQQKKMNDVLGQKAAAHHQTMEELRKTQEALAAARSMIPEPVAPVVPPMPDQFDENFETLMQQRDAAIAEAVRYQAQQDNQEAQRATAQQAQRQRGIDAFQKSVDTYTERAKGFGIVQADLQAASAVVNAGQPMNDNVVTFLLDDEQGPAITMYLSKNPEQLAAVKAMHPLKAAAFIEGTIKPAAKGSVKKADPPPPPVPGERGSGVSKERGPKGVTYL